MKRANTGIYLTVNKIKVAVLFTRKTSINKYMHMFLNNGPKVNYTNYLYYFKKSKKKKNYTI